MGEMICVCREIGKITFFSVLGFGKRQIQN